MGAISFASSFSNLSLMLSGAAALIGLTFVSNFNIPFSVMVRSSAEGYLPDICHRNENS